MKSDGGFLKFIYQGTRGENRFLELPAKGHYKIEDASLHAAHTSTKMHFSSSLLSSAILVLGYLTNAALCVPTNEPSKELKLVVNNNQQPLQSTGNCKRLLSLTGMFNGLTCCSTSHCHCYTSQQYAHTVDARRVGS